MSYFALEGGTIIIACIYKQENPGPDGRTVWFYSPGLQGLGEPGFKVNSELPSSDLQLCAKTLWGAKC